MGISSLRVGPSWELKPLISPFQSVEETFFLGWDTPHFFPKKKKKKKNAKAGRWEGFAVQ
jgi:hypothetical protein